MKTHKERAFWATEEEKCKDIVYFFTHYWKIKQPDGTLIGPTEFAIRDLKNFLETNKK